MGELKVISKSRSLVKEVYSLCKSLPNNEKYVLIPQICRAVISIPSNLVEGQQRTDREFIRFVNIARGSLEEVKIQLLIMEDLYFIKINNAYKLCNEIGKMTYRLLLKLKASAY